MTCTVPENYRFWSSKKDTIDFQRCLRSEVHTLRDDFDTRDVGVQGEKGVQGDNGTPGPQGPPGPAPTFTCQTRSNTRYSDIGDGNFGYLYGHHASCRENEVMQGFYLERNPENLAQIRYSYKCCAL